MSYKGRYKPINPSKYKGDPTNIIYRSLWERKLMSYLDNHKDILQWSSEEFFIPYRSPVDRRLHRYFPDFWVKKRSKDGQINNILIEVKPKKQTLPPEKKKRKTKGYIKEVMTYGINEAKWKAAIEFCKDRRWDFKIMTEDHLF